MAGGAQGPWAQTGIKAGSIDEAEEQSLPADKQTMPPPIRPQLIGWPLFNGQPIPLVSGVQGAAKAGGRDGQLGAGVGKVEDASGQKPKGKQRTRLPPLTKQLRGRSLGQPPKPVAAEGAQGPMLSQLGVMLGSMDAADEQSLPAARQTMPPPIPPSALQLRGWEL